MSDNRRSSTTKGLRTIYDAAQQAFHGGRRIRLDAGRWSNRLRERSMGFGPLSAEFDLGPVVLRHLPPLLARILREAAYMYAAPPFPLPPPPAPRSGSRF